MDDEIDNGISFSRATRKNIKAQVSRAPREPPVDGNDIGFQPGIPPPSPSTHHNTIIVYTSL